MAPLAEQFPWHCTFAFAAQPPWAFTWHFTLQSMFPSAVHSPLQLPWHFASHVAVGGVALHCPLHVARHDDLHFATHSVWPDTLSLDAVPLPEQWASQVPAQSASQCPAQSNVPGLPLHEAVQLPWQFTSQLGGVTSQPPTHCAATCASQ
jgi:hypothetical protein